MCGIYLALSRKGPLSASPALLELLQNRGPDRVNQVVYEVDSDDGTAPEKTAGVPSKVFISGASSVLSLRGDATVEQPAILSDDSRGHSRHPFLSWNGEAWTFAGAAIQGNDSKHVLDLLSHVSHAALSSKSRPHEEAIAEALAFYSGPYAFAFYEPSLQRIYFGRDILGRRSLLFRTNGDGGFVLSSVADVVDAGWTEVEADGIYFVDLNLTDSTTTFRPAKVSYCYSNDETPITQRMAIRPLTLNKTLPLPTPGTESSYGISAGAITTIHRLLVASLSYRVNDIPRVNTNSHTTPHIRPARLAVLFSGGLDCTLLARLTHDVLDQSEPIDLLNVAFQNPRVHRGNDATTQDVLSAYEQCPDRVTGRASYQELKQVCPNRDWRFVSIDIPYTETLAHRSRIISLMHPHNTEMDLSIACALYFAARGAGTTAGADGSSYEYVTAARVLLSGLGADELFGGYTRHGTAFRRSGFAGLADELELDVSRLGKRNLGRDDRVISNWAREARFPFLDESLVNWSLSIPIWEKCGFGSARQSTLDPTKQLLRLLALKLGMSGVANEKKRAIQFGARTAKMEVGRSKGTDVLVHNS